VLQQHQQQLLWLTSSRVCASWRVQCQQQTICCRLLLCHSLQQLLDVSSTADLQAANKDALKMDNSWC
jgi:hypothetical protein